MFKVKVWLLLLNLLLITSAAFGQDASTIFIYKAVAGETSQIRWFSLATPEQETSVDVPEFTTYAISPDGSYIAFKANGLDGFFYILNLLDESLTTIELYEPTLDFLWDSHYSMSATLLWSPDSSKLAFTGGEAPQDTQRTTEADVYVYDLATNELWNITENVSVVRSLIIPASWSPDSQWLIVNGAWSEYVDAQGYTIPDSGSALVSADGTIFSEIAPNFGTCRLEWSPDMRWLASNTACLVGVGDSFGLRAIPFDIDTVDDEHSIDRVIYPLELQTSQGWISYYGSPIWTDAETFVAFRRMTPITFGYFMDNTLSSAGLIRYNVGTYSETFFLEGEFNQQIDNWFISDTAAYNPLLDKQINYPESMVSCPPSYALRFDEFGNYMAVLDVCYLPNPDEPYTLRLYETAMLTELWSLVLGQDESVMPLGFIAG